mgnify:CR=1 FL=1
MQKTRPLIVVSSRTGNTRKLARAIATAAPDALMVDCSEMPADLSAFNPVLLGFWCDRGMAPEDMKAAACRLSGKVIGCFATMGGEPEKPESQAWMQKTAQALTASGEGNTLAACFLSMGRVDPEVFRRVTEMVGGLTPEREARRLRAEKHPDETDCAEAVRCFRDAKLI